MIVTKNKFKISMETFGVHRAQNKFFLQNVRLNIELYICSAAEKSIKPVTLVS